MARITPQLLLLSILSCCYLGLTEDSQAQTPPIIPDDTLGTNVIQSGNLWEINGGTQQGNNLFHSFQEFSLPSNNTALFKNNADITNIITRIIGGSLSNLDGLIEAQGNANLILINPAGINFGDNASLNIGGSFLVTTGNNLIFADGTVFSATIPENPLLTVSTPLGVQMGTNPASIQVQGANLAVNSGQNLTLLGGNLSLDGASLSGEKVNLGGLAVPGTISLEQDLTFPEGITQANVVLDNQTQIAIAHPQGVINLKSANLDIKGESVITALNQPGSEINLEVKNLLNLQGNSQIVSDYSGDEVGGDINIITNKLIISEDAFVSAATLGVGKGGNILIDASDSVEIIGTDFVTFQQTFQAGALTGQLTPEARGTGLFINNSGTGISGDIQIDTEFLQLANGGIIFNPTFSSGLGGNITVNAANLVDLNASALQTGSALGSTGVAGNLQINTRQLNLADGASVISATIGAGQGGNVEVNASEAIAIERSPVGALLLTGIYTNTTLGTGAGGDIMIKTGKLQVQDGVIASNTGALIPTGIIPFGGPGGNVMIEASEYVDLAGIQADTRFASGAGTTGYSASPAGDLTIVTPRLIIREGADASTATLGSGQGGTLTINASESVELTGILIDDLSIGGILAASGRTNLPDVVATGNSGDIRINTKKLIVQDRASVGVESLGTGDAGSLTIDANEAIFLENQGRITAATVSGAGGNINLQSPDIRLQQNSEISAQAAGSSDGGNILINSDTLVLLENSKITANAFEGRGGNIAINSQGVFVCPDCEITASSELGLDGVIDINTPNTKTQLEFLDLPTQITSQEQVVARSCAASEEEDSSELIITGRGGLPPRPNEPLNSQALVSFTDSSTTSKPKAPRNNSTLPPMAQGWYLNSDGVLVLSAKAANFHNSGLTPPDCHTAVDGK